MLILFFIFDIIKLLWLITTHVHFMEYLYFSLNEEVTYYQIQMEHLQIHYSPHLQSDEDVRELFLKACYVLWYGA